jgi:trehalose 6-phosphate phosphatase
MKILSPETDLDVFEQRLTEASQKALLLDYDGTLAPFQIDPNNAYPYPGVTDLLKNILQLGDTRLVIITGRWTKDLMPLLQLERQPEVWGSHGLERLKEDGSYEIATMDEEPLKGLVAADEWIESMGLSDRCERKPGCLAIHWRGLSEDYINHIKKQVNPEWSLIADHWGLKLEGFDGGLELRVPGMNKGDAVSTIIEEMDNDSVAAYLGDDSTDEDAFNAIKGKGIGVLVREEFRPTAADIWLKPPEELISFLTGWLNKRIDRSHQLVS